MTREASDRAEMQAAIDRGRQEKAERQAKEERDAEELRKAGPRATWIAGGGTEAEFEKEWPSIRKEALRETVKQAEHRARERSQERYRDLLR